MKVIADIFVHGFITVEFETTENREIMRRIQAQTAAAAMFTFPNDLSLDFISWNEASPHPGEVEANS